MRTFIDSTKAKVTLIFMLLVAPLAFAQEEAKPELQETTEQRLVSKVEPTKEEWVKYQADQMQLERDFVLNLQKLDAKLFCIAQNNYFEARGESLMGKIAVAEVVMNRTEHPEYPDDPCEVVKQSVPAKKPGPLTRICQFTWHCLGLGKIPLFNRQGEVNEKVYRQWYDSVLAAVLVTSGTVTVVGKATHFYAHNTVRPSWAGTKRLVRVIGNHTFMVRRK